MPKAQKTVKKPSTDALDPIRHSLAHLLAAAVLKKFPKAKLAIGPVIENGFYYDFKLPRAVTPEELKELEKTMREWIRADLKMKGTKVTPQKARNIFKDQPFKLELIKEFAKDKKPLTVYALGEQPRKPALPFFDTTTDANRRTYFFADLCRGGHVKSTADINPDAFMLEKVAGAYWRGDEKNPQLTRIYGLAFAAKEELDAHLAMMEEARKRDHKKLGPEMDLFVLSELVGAGLPLWTPKGTLVRNLLDDFVWSLRHKHGYEKVEIPHITKKDLYERSGHWDKYKDDLFRITTREGHEFAMKPMNCPHHTQIYARKPWSYRDLPQRYANTTMVYRDEQSGELAGITRVRSITQDDAHVFCRISQVKEEASKIWDIVHEFYGAFNIPLRVRLSVRDPKEPGKYLGDSKRWNLAEKMLGELVKDKGATAENGEGEAAFYGPKLDFMGRDAIGREHQVATIQLDMNQPERFDLTCQNEEGKAERIVMIHAAIMGSIERFMALAIEHFAGAFPLWLSPVQATVLPVSDKFEIYGAEVVAKLRAAGIRAEMSAPTESLGKRIREAEMQKVPYVLVVGEKEETAQTVAVRKRGSSSAKGEARENETPAVEELIKRMKAEVDSKSL